MKVAVVVQRVRSTTSLHVAQIAIGDEVDGGVVRHARLVGETRAQRSERGAERHDLCIRRACGSTTEDQEQVLVEGGLYIGPSLVVGHLGNVDAVYVRPESCRCW